LKIYDNHAPLITKRVKGKRSPWINQDIKNEINLCDSLHRKFVSQESCQNFNTYKIQCNKVKIIDNEHYQNLLTESSGNPKKFWKTLKRIFPTSEVIQNTNSLLIDGVLESKHGKIASSFCEFFLNMAAKVKNNAIWLKDFIWSKSITTYPKTYSSFHFKEILVDFKLLKKLKKQIDRS